MADENQKPDRILGYARRRTGWRRAIPFALLGLGVYLLVGCIPIPSTQQYMTNGKLKPSYAIGKSRGAEIRLGTTTIDQALRLLAVRITEGPAASNPSFIDQQVKNYSRAIVPIAHGRRYIIPYELRTGYLIWPLCFTAETESRKNVLALDVNDDNIVVDYHVADDAKDVMGYMPYLSKARPKPATRPGLVPPASQP